MYFPTFSFNYYCTMTHRKIDAVTFYGNAVEYSKLEFVVYDIDYNKSWSKKSLCNSIKSRICMGRIVLEKRMFLLRVTAFANDTIRSRIYSQRFNYVPCSSKLNKLLLKFKLFCGQIEYEKCLLFTVFSL